MGEMKGVLALILVVLIFLGIYVTFATDIFDPIMDKIGDGFTTTVDNIFKGIDSDMGN